MNDKRDKHLRLFLTACVAPLTDEDFGIIIKDHEIRDRMLWHDQNEHADAALTQLILRNVG